MSIDPPSYAKLEATVLKEKTQVRNQFLNSENVIELAKLTVK